ncbi:hypothetical protein XENOCAPTIV_005438, partial [Xenoophorus captivus]
RYDTDVYNPEAPSITNISRPIYRHRANAQRPNLIGLTMGEVDQPLREGALIQFTSPEEAKRAMQSTEAVLNNRFIKVHWFRDNMGDGSGQSRSQQLHPQPQSAMVFSTSTGITKTVYNPAARKAAQRTSEEALKKKQLLICKLEKNKAMKAEDKAKIMETLGTLTKSITKLQEEIKGLSSCSNLLRTAKSKAQSGYLTSCHFQAQKELLDAELDLYQKTQAGENTALLRIKRLKGEFFHRDEAGASTPEDAVLSGHGEGDPEVVEGVFHCMQLWTIDLERWTFLVLLMQTVWTYFHTLL